MSLLFYGDDPPPTTSDDNDIISHSNTTSGVGVGRTTTVVGGDIWSTGAFAFESPLKDLLDSQNYTLEQLLEQDELLQELRSCHPQLVEYFSKVETVEALVRFLIESPPPPSPLSSKERKERKRQSYSAGGEGKDETTEVITDGQDDNLEINAENAVNLVGREGNGESTRTEGGNDERLNVSVETGDESGELRQDAGSSSGGDLNTTDSSLSNESKGEENERPREEENTAKKSPPGEWLFHQHSASSSSNNSTIDDDYVFGASPSFSKERREMEAASENAYEMRYIRYPYMACEVICCEINGIIDALVDGKISKSPPSSTSTMKKTSLEHDEENNSHDDRSRNNDEDNGTPEGKEDKNGEDNSSKRHGNCQEGEVDPASPDDTSSSAPAAGASFSRAKPLLKRLGHIRSSTSSTLDDDDDNYINNHLPDDCAETPLSPYHPLPPPVSLLDLLFSMLSTTPPGKLDDRRAGYLEKILSVLFRRRPVSMGAYLNGDKPGSSGGGVRLLKVFFDQLHSNSIMQIVQRLLMPSPTPTPQTRSRDVEVDMEENGEAGNEKRFIEEGGGGGGVLVTSGWPMDALDEDLEDDIHTDNPGGLIRCNWSERPEVVELLLSRLVGPWESSSGKDQENFEEKENKEEEEERILNLSQNASEILITIVQNSPLNSPTLVAATTDPALSRIVDGATTHRDGRTFEMHDSTLTCAMNVLESIVLQLGGYGAVGTGMVEEEEESEDDPGANESMETISDTHPGDTYPGQTPIVSCVPDKDGKEEEEMNPSPTLGKKQKTTIAKPTTIIAHLPNLLMKLSQLLRHPCTKTWTSPTQYRREHDPALLLGASRLRIVRLLESLVLLGNAEVDNILCRSDCLSICLDLFWEFEWCSMLHQSVANLLVHVFEGANERRNLQEYFLLGCDLIRRLMDSFENGAKTAHEIDMDGGAGTMALDEKGEENTRGEKREGKEVARRPDESSGPRYSDVVFAMKSYADTGQSTSSVESERGSISSSGSEEEIIPVSEDDVEAALEQQKDVDIEMSAVMDEEDSNNENQNHDTGASKNEGENGEILTQLTDMEVSVEKTSGVSAEAEPAKATASGIEPPSIEGRVAIPPKPQPPIPSFRMGYMGHVIIICQSLVHACSENKDADGQSGAVSVAENESFDVEAAAEVVHSMNMNGEGSIFSQDDAPTRGNDGGQRQLPKKRKVRPPSSESDDEDEGVKEEKGDQAEGVNEGVEKSTQPLTIPSGVSLSVQKNKPTLEMARMIQSHPLYSRWEAFITTTLASETAVQSTPLGGFNSSAAPNTPEGPRQYRSSLTEPGEGGGGLIVGGEIIDMDDNDLDIAASMMEALSLPPTSATAMDEEVGTNGGGHHRGHHRVIGGKKGSVTMSDRADHMATGFGTVIEQPHAATGEYFYHDPLGRGRQFDDDDDSDDEEDDDHPMEEGGFDRSTRITNVSSERGDGCDEGDSSDGEEDDDDVPVMDLFAGNFSFEDAAGSGSSSGEPASAIPGGDDGAWANFANFDEAFASSGIPEPTPIMPSGGDANAAVTADSSNSGASDDSDPFRKDDPKTAPNIEDIFAVSRDVASRLVETLAEDENVIDGSDKTKTNAVDVLTPEESTPDTDVRADISYPVNQQ